MGILLDRLCKNAALLPGVELLAHQERLREMVKREPAVLAYWSTGAGKTLGAIAAGEEVEGDKTVVAPAALRTNFGKELGKFTDGRGNYLVRSYHAAAKHLPDAALTIFDESQRTGREGTSFSQLPGRVQGKALFLSGTPVRNHPEEFAPMLRALAADRGAPQTAEAFRKLFIGKRDARSLLQWVLGSKPRKEETLINTDRLAEMLRGRVDYQPAQGEFPDVEEEEIDVDMTDRQTQIYRTVAAKANPVLAYMVRRNLPPNKRQSAQLNAFMTAVRQAANNPAVYDVTLGGSVEQHSPKMQRAADEFLKRLKEDPDFKGVIYSNYRESGIDPMAALLASRGVPVARFHGSLTDPGPADFGSRRRGSGPEGHSAGPNPGAPLQRSPHPPGGRPGGPPPQPRPPAARETQGARPALFRSSGAGLG